MTAPKIKLINAGGPPKHFKKYMFLRFKSCECVFKIHNHCWLMMSA